MNSALFHLISALLLLFSLPFYSTAQSNRNISLGSSLSTHDNKSWPSPSRDFVFGFRRLGNDDLFLLAIWFDKIPEKTVVWSANGDDPAPRGSKLELTNSGQLMLKNPQGQTIWEAKIIRDGVAYAAMLDTGNFVLARTDSEFIWQSFENPTDTILPTQTLEINGIISSRQGEENYSKGRFQLRLLEDGNLVLNPIAFPTTFTYEAYYISYTFEADKQNSGYQLVFNESGQLYILRRNGNIFIPKPAQIGPVTDFYYRATLDFDGVFAQYSHPRSPNGNQRWTTVWSIPDDICTGIFGLKGSGACGFNSYCELTTDKRPNCKCPSGYSFKEPDNQFSGCKPEFRQGCEDDGGLGSPEDQFDFNVLPGIDWPTSDYERLEPYSEVNCRNSCLHDCFCAVAIFRSEACWKKRLPLSNGRFNGVDNGKALVKIRKVDPSLQNSNPSTPETKQKNQDTLILVLSVLLGSSVLVNFLMFVATSLVLFILYHKKLNENHKGTNGLETNLRCFTYKDLEKATDGFKEELGRGAFGIVYKGFPEDSSGNFVAIKKLDKLVHEGEKEFKTEVIVIGQTHHKNLVRLLGFCEEGLNRLLVYEFMSNGTLADFLFGGSRPDWNQRIQIAFGTARGLVYLHEECSTQIIHCDIKPQNILLDEFFVAKISDFGLAKLLMTNQSRTHTAIRGTKGYVAPEWFRRMPVTVKVDVYSFGVVLLEIICCRKNVEMELGEEGREILIDWAYDCYCQGRLDALVENDTEAMNDMRRLETLVMVAIWCIQEEPSLRPTMKKVSQMLEGVVEVSVPPFPSPFSTMC